MIFFGTKASLPLVTRTRATTYWATVKLLTIKSSPCIGCDQWLINNELTRTYSTKFTLDQKHIRFRTWSWRAGSKSFTKPPASPQPLTSLLYFLTKWQLAAFSSRYNSFQANFVKISFHFNSFKFIWFLQLSLVAIWFTSRKLHLYGLGVVWS